MNERTNEATSDGTPTPDAGWAALARLTPARIALGRAGASLPTREVLRFGLAHAQARDAVHLPFRGEEVAAALAALGQPVLTVASAAPSRALYLRRPDLGRSLAADSRQALAAQAGRFDLALVVADGLSATAVHEHAAALVGALLPEFARQGLVLAPLVLASQARVALGDEAAEALGARAVLVLIGERPGLSSPDSLGAYLTFAARRGVSDAARNCVSNIRPGGLGLREAAFKLAWLTAAAFSRGLTGVALKDESDRLLLDTAAQGGAAALPAPDTLPG
jgi:ethanolamine ammonia-lyase small subunit